MKVAIVTHNIIQGDGQGRVNYELTRFLLAEGIEVDLIADRVAPELVAEGASWIPVRPGVDSIDLIKVWRFKRMADRLLSEMASRYDLILGCGVVLGHPHTINVAHFVHGTWLRSEFHAAKAWPGPRGWYQWLFSSLNANWERHVFRAARVVVAVSEMVRQELAEIGVPPEDIEVIVNGVDLQNFAPGAADHKALGLPEDVILGLFVGDIQSPIKNLDGVLHALVEVPNVHLAVVGALNQSPYPALAEKLDLADRVHFLGFRRDVADLMRASDLFVLVSRRDSCPLVLLEAMASGLPVITARTVGTANLIGDACGFVLERPDDQDTLIHGLRTLSGNAHLRQAMGRAARLVAEQHSWDQMSRRYLDLFNRLSR